MTHQQFGDKWLEVDRGVKHEEFSIFVPKGEKPRTQRQFNLFNYYEFVHSVIGGRGYRDAIELGCGRGTMALYLRLYEGLRVVCNDSEESAVALARKNFALYGAEGEFVVADAAVLPFPPASFDVAVSIGLLEHLPEYRPLVAEQWRILRPGGVMISLNIPKKFSVQFLNKSYRRLLRLLKPSVALKPDYYRNSETPEGFARAARECGFEGVYVVPVNSFPLFTPVGPSAERMIAALYRGMLGIRRLFLSYPFRASQLLSQAHFLVGFKRSL